MMISKENQLKFLSKHKQLELKFQLQRNPSASIKLKFKQLSPTISNWREKTTA